MAFAQLRDLETWTVDPFAPRGWAAHNISEVVATRDFKRLSELGLLVPVGQKRGRYYVASDALLQIALRTRGSTKAGDPYDIVRRTGQLEFFETGAIA